MKIGILGSGAFGIALASILIDKNDVIMWTKFEDEKNEIANNHTNSKVLPNVIIDENIAITTDIKECVYNKDIIIICIPVKFVGETLDLIKDYISEQEIIIASKGIDEDNNMFISQLVKEKLKTDKVSVLAGGTFAIDLIDKKNFGLTIAGSYKSFDNIKNVFNRDYVTLDICDNMLAVEVCSSLKNIYAIIFGMLDGLSCNISTRAFYFTNMINDFNNILTKLELDSSVIYSYAGIGDVFLTCTSPKSRNFSFGKILVSSSNEEIKSYLESTTVEGVNTLKSIKKILDDNHIKVKMIDTLHDIVFENKNYLEILKK